MTLCITGVLVSCSPGKVYQFKKEVNEPLYREMNQTDTVSIAQMGWQEFFSDADLKNLIQSGLQNNLDLKMGIQRIEIAHSMLKQSRAAFLPEVSGGGGIKQSKMSYPQGLGNSKNTALYDVYANASWEIDIWGKLASNKRAFLYRLMQSESMQRAVQTQIVAQIADYYYQLLTLDKQQVILEKTIENRELDVKTMNRLKESNIVTGAAVVQSEANYYDAQADLPRIKRQIREVENAINVLLGQAAQPIIRGSLDHQKAHYNLNVGVPSQLLANRPDVHAMELEVASYFEEINIAQRAFYPSLTITASGGFSSFELKDWFSSTGFFANIAGGLIQPIFNKRLNKTRLEIAQANYREKVYDFQKALITAGQEVSDALYSYESATEQEQKRMVQIDKLSLAVDYTKKLLVYHSSTNYTDVLTSEQAYLSSQIQLTNDQLLKWRSVIKLYRSLGGGVR
ncbi:TolC family protein [Chryseobacterium sp. BIGb0232]|uniref:TolC family protein n=1 Tax=Chryseobacterium sp. BIGb0232 TaxID=2940598 RepID=UPI000FA1C344|nr:TolC family protein [Chryseobacterium sp. BIGb0232]MCS4302778.1 NodT family efflux transporter outer membrane factor (OMF) lipoprotein [Chryseobacterium sp. BIGb0232]ROS17430.1 NodT family efflux transporter outer membrane factor (OMF) lipoprotein [Chryseobacterium nakagawai]